MSSLDELVDALLNEHAAKKAADTGVAQTAVSQSAGNAGAKAGDSLEDLLKNAGVGEQGSTQLRAELNQARSELESLRQQNQALAAQNAALKQTGNSAQTQLAAQSQAPPSDTPEQTRPSGTFVWKRHISAVEAALRKKELAVAEPLIQALVDVSEVVSAEPAIRVRLMTQLGTIRIERREYGEADEILTKALQSVETLHSPTVAEQLAQAFCLDALAQSHLEREDFDPAERLRRRAVVIADDAVGAEHPDSGYFRERLETLRELRQTANIGKDEGSKTLYDKLTEEYNATGGQVEEEKPQDSYSGFMFEKFLGMAKTALAQKNILEGESNLRTAITKADGVANSDPRKSEAIFMLAQITDGQGKQAQAKELYEQALTLAFRRSWRDIEVAHCLKALAETHSSLNDFGVAKNYYTQALGLYTTILGAEDETVVALQTKYKEFLERLKEERQWKGWSA